MSIKPIEVFRTGPQTDSAGNTRDWTEADLDQIVANFVAEGDTVPHVVGHPETDAPAYGWIQRVWREGKSLYVASRDVAAKFAEAVNGKVFPNRSIKLLRGDNGWRLGHVGWLGAAAPAVEGLKPFAFSSGSSESCVFTARSQEPAAMFTQADLDKAASDAAAKAKSEADAAHQAKLDTANAELKKLQFAQRVAKSRAVIEGFAVRGNDVHITPAQREGLAEFRARLVEDSPSEFAFTASDKSEKKVTLVACFDGLLKSMPAQMKLGQQQATDDPPATDTDPGALALKAQEFQKAQADKGRTVSIAEAVAHVRANP